MRWEDIDLDASRPSVAGALQQVDGRLILVEPKTRRSRRTLPLTTSAVATLRAQRQLEERLRAGSRWQQGSDDLVWTTPVGAALDGVELTRTSQRLLAPGTASDAVPRPPSRLREPAHRSGLRPSPCHGDPGNRADMLARTSGVSVFSSPSRYVAGDCRSASPAPSWRACCARACMSTPKRSPL